MARNILRSDVVSPRIGMRSMVIVIFAIGIAFVGYRLVAPARNINDSLIVAVIDGDLNTVEYLLKHGANPNSYARDHLTGDGDDDCRTTWAKFVDNITGNVGIEATCGIEPVLHFATKDVRMMRILLQYGADINAPLKVDSCYFYNALYLAINANQVQSVRFLLKHGADYSRKCFPDEYVIDRAKSFEMSSLLAPYRKHLPALPSNIKR